MRRPSHERACAFVGAGALSLLALVSLACSDLESSGAGDPAAAPQAAAEPAPAATPAGTAPHGDMVVAAGLALELPAGFRSVPPESQMRAAQLVIDGAGGEGQVAVFHFGVGGGGGVDANLQRWVGQMAEASAPVRETFTVGDLEVVWIDLSGTLLRSTIGSFPTEDMPDYRMFGAVVSGGQGPWFIRGVGPEATMAEHRDNFVALLQSAREVS